MIDWSTDADDLLLANCIIRKKVFSLHVAALPITRTKRYIAVITKQLSFFLSDANYNSCHLLPVSSNLLSQYIYIYIYIFLFFIAARSIRFVSVREYISIT